MRKDVAKRLAVVGVALLLLILLVTLAGRRRRTAAPQLNKRAPPLPAWARPK